MFSTPLPAEVFQVGGRQGADLLGNHQFLASSRVPMPAAPRAALPILL
jgi:hypothetical protein